MNLKTSLQSFYFEKESFWIFFNLANKQINATVDKYAKKRKKWSDEWINVMKISKELDWVKKIERFWYCTFCKFSCLLKPSIDLCCCCAWWRLRNTFAQMFFIDTMELIQKSFIWVFQRLVVLIVCLLDLIILIVQLILCVLVGLCELNLASVHTCLLRNR